MSKQSIPKARWLGLALLGLVCCCGVLSAAAESNDKPSLEHKVKAAFLVNFLKFVEWPAESLPQEDALWTIGIVGEDPFGDYIDGIAKRKIVAGREVEIKRLSIAHEEVKEGDETVRRLKPEVVADLKKCQILFISSKEEEAKEVLAAVGDAPVFSVGEQADFIADGGVTRFYLDKNKVRFEIKPAVARARKLKVSSKLLRLARIVED